MEEIDWKQEKLAEYKQDEELALLSEIPNEDEDPGYDPDYGYIDQWEAEQEEKEEENQETYDLDIDYLNWSYYTQ